MKHSILKTFLVLIAPALLFSFVKPPARANFSAEWALNEGKSELGDFGGRFAPRKIKVEQKEDGISIAKTAPSFDGGEATTTENLTFDGKQAESTVFGTSKKKTSIKWADDGQSFAMTYTILLDFDGNTTEIKGTEIWTMAADGKSFTSVTSSSSPQGEFTMKGMYEKK